VLEREAELREDAAEDRDHGGARIGAEPRAAAGKYAAESVSARMRHVGGYEKMHLRKSTARQ
jgi:hypothetical protein